MNWFKKLFGGKKPQSRAKITSKASPPSPPVTTAELRQRFGALATSAVHLRATENPSFSQLGGEPLLPEEVRWPEWKGKPLSFLAPIDLAEVHAVLPSFLPRSGLLLFFYDQDQSVWGFDPKDEGAWKVFHVEGEVAYWQRRSTPAGVDKGARFQCKPIAFHAMQSFPDAQRIESGFARDRDWDAYYELRHEAFEGDVRHQMLGYPSPVQSDDMELDCQLASNGIYLGGPEGYQDARVTELKSGAKDWKLLLQLDSDDDAGWMWGNAGTLYFWIREQDARRGDFSKVWLSFQCC